MPRLIPRRLFLLLALLAAGPAWARFTEPIDLGSASTATGGAAALTLPLAAACPQHGTVWIGAHYDGNAGLDPAHPPTDAGGNAYTVGTATSAPGPGVHNIAWSINIATALAAGSSLTVTFANNNHPRLMAAACLIGITSLDHEGTGYQGSDMNPFATSGVLQQDRDELTIFSLVSIGPSPDLNFEEDAAVDPVGLIGPAGTGSAVLRWAWERPPSSSAIGYDPVTSSQPWIAKAITFKGAPEIVPPVSFGGAIGGGLPAARIRPRYGYQFAQGYRCDGADASRLCWEKALDAVPAFSLFRLGVDNTQPPSVYDGNILPLVSRAKPICALLNMKNRAGPTLSPMTLGDAAAGAPQIRLDSTAGLYYGQSAAAGTSLPGGAMVQTVDDATHVTLSAAPIATIPSGTVITFSSGLGTAPKTGDRDSYKTQIKGYLDHFNLPPWTDTHPAGVCVVTIENEFGNGNNIQEYIPDDLGNPTPPTYAQLNDRAQIPLIAATTATLLFRQFTWAAEAVHEWNALHQTSPPVLVAAGGISSSGVRLWAWYDLWTSGQHALADNYAEDAFQGADGQGVRTLDLPNSTVPDRPILAGNAKGYLTAIQTNYLVNGIGGMTMKATLMDCANAHMFGVRPDTGLQLSGLRHIYDRFGMACRISDAVGQKDETPKIGPDTTILTAAGVADAAEQLRLSIVSLFGATPKPGDNASGILDFSTGLLNGRGCVYRDTWGGHRARRGECRQ